MSAPVFILQYVESAPVSTAFYAELLGVAPLESSPGFAMFALNDGARLGLWSRAGVAPAPDAPAGGGELGLPVASNADVDARHTQWSARGVRIAQPPVDLDFGRTFVALDPDGHRVRVFCPSGA